MYQQNEGVDDVVRRISEALAAREMSLNAVSEQAGLTRGLIYKIMSGERTTMNIETLLGIAIALGVSADWLLTGEGPRDRAVLLGLRAPDAPPPTPEPGARRKRGFSKAVETIRSNERSNVVYLPAERDKTRS